MSTASPKRDAKTGTWHFVVDGGVGPDGKRRQVHRRGFATRKEAQAELDKIRGKARTRSYVPPTKLTVAAYLDEWLKGLPARGIRPSTADSYERCIAYVTPTLGGRRLDSLTAHDLDRLYSELLAGGGRGGSPLKPRTVRYVHTVVRKALDDAVRKETLSRNVAAVASPPSAKATRAPEMAWWTPAELRQFLEATSAEALGPLFRLAGMTGMRRGEVCGLRWSDVDLDVGRLEVRQQLLVVRGAPDGGLMFSERTKTDHGRRRIDLDPGTVSVLRQRRKVQAEQRLVMGAGWQNGERDLVFTELDGRPVDPESVAKVFDRRVARIGLRRIRFHDLRHSHVAHLIAAGEQPLLIARRLGHASASFTLDRYGHLFEQAGSQAAVAVAAMVDGGAGA